MSFSLFHASIVGFVAFALCAMRGESNALSPILWGWSSLLYHWSLHLLATLLHLNDDLWNCFVPIHVAALSEAVCVSVGLHCGGSGIGLSFSSLLDCRLASCKVKWSELSLLFHFLHKSLRCTLQSLVASWSHCEVSQTFVSHQCLFPCRFCCDCTLRNASDVIFDLSHGSSSSQIFWSRSWSTL